VTINTPNIAPPAVDRREVARLLGYPNGPLPARVTNVIARAEKNASALLHPAAAWTLADRTTMSASDYLRDIDRAALCVVTIGGALEREVEVLRGRGDLGPALILDAYGSAAAEAAADAAETIIRAALEDGATRCSRRFSPGYGGWNVAEQRWIIDALRTSEIGVELTPGCMMTPRKSVSFAMTVGENPLEFRDDDICSACGAVDCRWRDTPNKCPGRYPR
jgi:hypothetical protein